MGIKKFLKKQIKYLLIMLFLFLIIFFCVSSVVHDYLTNRGPEPAVIELTFVKFVFFLLAWPALLLEKILLQGLDLLIFIISLLYLYSLSYLMVLVYNKFKLIKKIGTKIVAISMAVLLVIITFFTIKLGVFHYNKIVPLFWTKITCEQIKNSLESCWTLAHTSEGEAKNLDCETIEADINTCDKESLERLLGTDNRFKTNHYFPCSKMLITYYYKSQNNKDNFMDYYEQDKVYINCYDVLWW